MDHVYIISACWFCRYGNDCRPNDEKFHPTCVIKSPDRQSIIDNVTEMVQRLHENDGKLSYDEGEEFQLLNLEDKYNIKFVDLGYFGCAVEDWTSYLRVIASLMTFICEKKKEGRTYKSIVEKHLDIGTPRLDISNPLIN